LVERGKNFTISTKISDATPNVTVELKIDGISIETKKLSNNPPSQNTPVSFQVNITFNNLTYNYTFDYGLHTSTLILSDAFGKSAQIDTDFTITDTTPPNLIFTNITPGKLVEDWKAYTRINSPLSSSNRLEFYLKTTDELAICTLVSPGIPVLIDLFPSSDHIVILQDYTSTYYPQNGVEKYYTITCIDQSGNSIAKQITVINDLTSPIILSITPKTGDLISYFSGPSGNRIADLNIITNENTTCKYYGNLTQNVNIPLPTLAGIETFYDNNK